MRYALAGLALMAATAASTQGFTAQGPGQPGNIRPVPQSCNFVAVEKKLSGAAKTSFLAKCEGDATAACETRATTQKLAGAAKASFTTKCMSDAVGKPA